jgi:REP-associated tyrosine transposase
MSPTDIRGRIKAFIEQRLFDIYQYHPDIEIEKYSIQKDHLHIVIVIPPKYSVSSIIGKIKVNPSREIRQHFEWKRKMYKHNEFRSPGFFSSTVGIDEDVIKR